MLYARPGSDADTRIQELIGKSSNKRNITLVTSDRALAESAKRRGATVIPSGQFRKMMADALALDLDKPVNEQPVNVEDWLDYFEGSKH